MNTLQQVEDVRGQVLSLLVFLVLLWVAVAFALRRVGPWKGDSRVWMLSGLFLGCGACSLVAFVAVSSLLDDGVTVYASGKLVAAGVVLIGISLGLFARWLARDIRRSRSTAIR